MVGEEGEEYDPRFRVPGNMQIVGPSLSGKTTWLYKLLKDASHYFRTSDGKPCHFQKMLYCHGTDHPPLVEPFTKLGVTFHQGLPPLPLSDTFTLKDRPGLLVLDDLMQETAKSEDMLHVLTRDTHHLNLFAITLNQNLYPGGKHQATQNRNYHYTVLFKNPADTRYVKALGNRWTGDAAGFFQVYQKATEKPYGYLVVDHHPQTPEAIRFRTHLLLDDPEPLTVLQQISI